MSGHPEGNQETNVRTETHKQPHLLPFSVAQRTWPPCFPTSLAGSSSTPSSTWAPSGSSRCSSQTHPSCRASWSSASSQVRLRFAGHRVGLGRMSSGGQCCADSAWQGVGLRSSIHETGVFCLLLCLLAGWRPWAGFQCLCACFFFCIMGYGNSNCLHQGLRRTELILEKCLEQHIVSIS